MYTHALSQEYTVAIFVNVVSHYLSIAYLQFFKSKA